MFEEVGFYKDYFVNGKYTGSLVCDKDRDVFGYQGRINEIVNDNLILTNKKKIKKGTEVMTILQIICGKLKK